MSLTDKAIVHRPVFVIGTGRSGTTLLFNMLATHPDVAWPCQYMVGDPLRGRDWVLHCLKRLPIASSLLANNVGPRRPVSEPYEFWRRFVPAFNHSVRDLDERDVSQRMIDGVRCAFSKQQAAMRRPRFLTKYTGWSRIRFVDSIFPDALYVNVVRDPRAVAWSLMNVDWWRGWQGPSQWRWGELSDGDQDIWERSGRSFFILAGIQWKILMDNITQAAAAVADRYYEIRYEAVVACPDRAMDELRDWCGLAGADKFRDAVRRRTFRNANEDWRIQLPSAEQRLFETLLKPALERYGYVDIGDCVTANQ